MQKFKYKFEDSMYPDFFIIGGPKCGTTSLYTYLDEHSKIVMSEPKEPHHFAPELSDYFVTHRSPEDYATLFAGTAEDQITGEASVLYLQSETAIDNILSVRPNAKFIAMVRNPVDMAISLHRQAIKSGHEDKLDFLEAWNLQKRRKKGLGIPKKRNDADFLQYKKICSLGSQLERFFDRVPKKQRLVIVMDDMKNDMLSVYKDCLLFLGLPYDNRTDFKIINRTTNAVSPLMEKRVREIYYKKIPILGHIVYALHNTYASKIRHVIRPGYSPKEIKTLSNDTKDTLKREFKPEIKKMERLLNRNFSHWYQ